MSEETVHVHSVHELEVEHQAHRGVGLAKRVAMFTAVLATIGALLSYQGGFTQNQAILYKNEAVLKKAAASDQWAFYQAKSNKQHLLELAKELAPPPKQEYYAREIARYEQEKQAIKVKAEALDEESKKAEALSEHALHPHHRLALAMTLIQIAISLASITVLTEQRWLFILAGLVAAGGLLVAALSFYA
ncbi:MAG TPA: DUF4337 domain-containing protein [Candidatus Competibacteraceae bacterium]|nr:DUF4337 domain-containing protein [Candidatus Competibacteraceae bacterium]